jgi:hypothetical protein
MFMTSAWKWPESITGNKRDSSGKVTWSDFSKKFKQLEDKKRITFDLLRNSNSKK